MFRSDCQETSTAAHASRIMVRRFCRVWSCATYKRFLHLASQVSTKYTASELKFSRKERPVCAQGFVEIFPPAASFLFLPPPPSLSLFLSLCSRSSLSTPVDSRANEGRNDASRCPNDKEGDDETEKGLKEGRRHRFCTNGT